MQETKKLQKRLRIISGQVNGLEKMIADSSAECKEILTQLKAVMSAMRSVGNDIVQQAIVTCAKEATEDTNQIIKDIIKLHSTL